jgi:hypothetical protein
MIIHKKPTAYGLGKYEGTGFRNPGKPRPKPDKPKEGEKEFFSEEEFKII